MGVSGGALEEQKWVAGEEQGRELPCAGVPGWTVCCRDAGEQGLCGSAESTAALIGITLSCGFVAELVLVQDPREAQSGSPASAGRKGVREGQAGKGSEGLHELAEGEGKMGRRSLKKPRASKTLFS